MPWPIAKRGKPMENMEVINSYTAEQAVDDGFLVDVSEMAKEAGFRWTVRISQGVHNLCTPPKSNKIQSYKGRLWDVLWIAHLAVRKAQDDYFSTFKVKLGPRIYSLWAVVDGTSEPAIHIILPEEY